MSTKKLIKGIIYISGLLVSMTSYGADVSIITEEPGGGWYTYGTTFSKVIEQSTDGQYSIKVIPRGGGMTNPVMVDRGKADFGFATSNSAAWAQKGMTKIFKGKESKNIRSVLNGLQEAYTLIAARQSWVEETGNDTLEKILEDDDVRIATPPNGSQVPIIANFIFESMGTSLSKLKDEGAVIQVGGSQMSQLLRDNGIDVFIENVPANHPDVTEMALTTDLEFIPYPQKVLDDLAEVGLPSGNMPPNTYGGQEKAYENPISASIFMANASVDKEAVYDITKSLVESREKIQESHAPLRVWDPEESAMNSTLKLHPGAKEYYKERGWVD